MYSFNACDVRSQMEIINCADLIEERFPRIDWIIEGLLKPGLSVLAGAPKIGKSWMVLQMCLCIAKGEPFLGMPTRQGDVLYISLEDSKMRIQERVLRITEEFPNNLMVTLKCPSLGNELKAWCAVFCADHPSARLIVIDTFQKIREQEGQMTYAGDYADVSAIKEIADELNIAILLVHHTRKLSDSDYINEISGTNGIAGSADSLMILKKEKRTDSKAVLSCTGRDIEDRAMELNLKKDTCTWELLSEDYKPEPKEIPPMLLKLIVFAGQIKNFDGSNTEFCERFAAYCGESVRPNRLKRLMNLYRYELEDAGVYFLSLRNVNGRRFALYYQEREDGLSLPEEDAKEEAALWEDVQTEPHDAPAPLPDSDPITEEPYRFAGQPYEEQTLWDCALDDMPPPPGDEDAPPERRSYF